MDFFFPLLLIMLISNVKSVERIVQQFSTGERPVLVECDDWNTYVCKYPRFQGAAYKLFSELAGGILAKLWGLNTPDIAFVNLCPEHWPSIKTDPCPVAPAIGSRLINEVVDLTPRSSVVFVDNSRVLGSLLDIALFDFWVANEDRNANNMNMMYNPDAGQIISIDYGCIFNTAMYDYPMSQLTFTDSILTSDLFINLAGKNHVIESASKQSFFNKISRCRTAKDFLVDIVPKGWKLKPETINDKLSQLFDEKWIDDAWDNFQECLNER